MDIKSKEPLFAEERKQKILELIKKSEKVTVDQLSALFNVSSSTIRNDLRELESSELLTRTHGGAMAKTKAGFEQDTRHKQGEHKAEKEKIADLAIKMIEDGDVIILDTGTTTFELAERLQERRNLTAVVNDIEIARRLEDIEDINIIFIGGILRKKFHCTVGTWGASMLSGLAADKAFIAANGLSVKKGATTPDINHAEMKKAMLSIAAKVILLCDSSKIGRSSFARFASPDQIDTLITDEGINEEIKCELEAEGIEVLIAK